MAPPSRLIGLAALTLAVAGCTASTTPPGPTVTSSPTATAPTVLAPASAAAALAAHPAAHTPPAYDPEETERLWLRRGENTIDTGGSYRVRGWVRGSIVVDAGTEPVVLVLDGLDLRSSEGPAIDVKSAGTVLVVAEEG
ncbi:MAG: carbohydrate-binding domain-containing protein, partial [Propionicimonas sp.]|nr:carbohydrate-binding domain-containing protein [Propionicimonas sp.]